MDQNKIDLFLAQNADKLPKVKIMQLQEALAKLDDSKAIVLQTIDFKDPTTVLILSVLLGCWGVDRFMLGEAGLGVLKLLTCGGCYIWWIIDMINATDRTRDYNYKKLQEVLLMQGVTIY
jgi:TM2 domain-containing membrane protein YozV